MAMVPHLLSYTRRSRAGANRTQEQTSSQLILALPSGIRNDVLYRRRKATPSRISLNLFDSKRKETVLRETIAEAAFSKWVSEHT